MHERKIIFYLFSCMQEMRNEGKRGASPDLIFDYPQKLETDFIKLEMYRIGINYVHQKFEFNVRQMVNWFESTKLVYRFV